MQLSNSREFPFFEVVEINLPDEKKKHCNWSYDGNRISVRPREASDFKCLEFVRSIVSRVNGGKKTVCNDFQYGLAACNTVIQFRTILRIFLLPRNWRFSVRVNGFSDSDRGTGRIFETVREGIFTRSVCDDE